jgi:hypothetical protein
LPGRARAGRDDLGGRFVNHDDDGRVRLPVHAQLGRPNSRCWHEQH